MTRRVLIVALLALVALPASASAAESFISKSTARSISTLALERTYTWKWEFGVGKEVKPTYRISRSHYQVSWSFNNDEATPPIYCWGDVIVFRDRQGSLWYRVRSDKADGSDC